MSASPRVRDAPAGTREALGGRAPADAFIFTSLGIRAGFMRHCLHFVRFLSMHGCDVVLYGFSPALPRDAGFHSVTLAAHPLGAARLFARSLWKIVTARGLVVLSTQANYVQVFLVLAAFALRRPVVYDMQDPVPESFVALFGRRFPKLFVALVHEWLMLSESIICTTAAVVCVVSPGMKANILARRTIGDKLYLFPNSHSVERSDATRFARPTIVFAGGLQPFFRGLEVQVEALTYPIAARFRLVIAGEGERAWLDERVSRAGVADRVEIVGFLQDPDVRALWAQSHLLVVENLSYGLPSKLFEAVAAGVVVVSPSTSTDVNAVLGDAAVTFDGSSGDLAKALDTAWQHLDRLRQRQRLNTEAFLRVVDCETQALGARIEELVRMQQRTRKRSLAQ